MNTLVLQFKKVTPLCLIVFALGCLALLPRAQAVSPPPDGDYTTSDTAQGLGDNTAIGANTLCNMMMLSNTPYGCHALEGNTTGRNNTAIGFSALENNGMGDYNTAFGFNALYQNITGSRNIALGAGAGRYLTSGSDNIYIGNAGVMSESATIRIGKGGTHMATFIAGISSAPVMNGVQVMVSGSGKLGTMLSSARFKEAIKPMDKASEAVLALQPVTFRYKPDLDPDGIPQFGLIAEQVEKVNPHLVARDADGKVNTVRYEAVNAMLLNEFLKEHKAFLEEQRKVEQLEKQVEKLTAGLQTVSAQIELSKPAPQTVLNNH